VSSGEEKIVSEDQHTSREVDGEANSDCVKTKRACVIHVEAADVTQRTREVAQCLRRLTQRVSG